MDNTTINPLLCDVESGMCELPGFDAETKTGVPAQAKQSVSVIYFTDPICSTCWGIEPQLRKLKLEYGHSLDIEYRMGGLLPDWSYNSGGISKPSDVAPHWDEVSLYYDMPIDGDVWLEDPLSSSYPASIACKAAQLQGEKKALLFLREIREMVFLQKTNIATWENLEAAARNVGLNVETFTADYNGQAQELFQQDLALARQLGVRGFPTLFFVDQAGNQEKVYGYKPYSDYENAIHKQLPSVSKSAIDTDWQNLFAIYRTLTSREFAELSGMDRNEVDGYLQKLSEAGYLRKLASKNGPLWIRQ
ncbi:MULTISPECIES: ClpXP adapter SpxH family protein [unclassified Spirosoma]|uniref:ClpXP adapter SpxH family protein n=1 Tax=unclassified Spirosoma TaxID=2621999 RepID=UPI0009608BF8|nr:MULTISPECIES: ClpXP adapter SpxH family protein [unclassified Spirosoma]MBN8823469.1 DsbA family protein [Spirosoma sp.]OJW71919.1 MAG: dithiol-disulfide isomerase [Spirosoma sp. 48-14]